MKKVNRRSFLATTATGAAALSIPARSWSQVLGSADDVRVAVVGFGGRGQSHISGMSKQKGVRLTGLCDVDTTILGKEQQKWKDKGVEVEAHTDMRKLLESKNVDVICIATPNHWHALASIWAVQAGKDVYVEKPVSHNVWEGRKIVEAARKYKKIVQTGTQSRTSLGIAECFAWLKEGNLGKMTLARGLCYKPRPSIGKVEGPQPVPPGVDYDLWCGPAPVKPIMRKQFHYDWHWIWDTGNGDLGNQGIHQMDIARWALGVNELSPRVFSVGGRLGYVDDGQTPNTQIVLHDYSPAPLIFEVRGLPANPGERKMDNIYGASVGVILYYEGGYVVVPNYNSATAFDKDGQEVKKWRNDKDADGNDHFENFSKAVRSRKHTDLNADILEGHLSSALCHTGNISYLLGRAAGPDEIKDTIKSDKNLTEAYGRMEEHLGRNNVDLTATKATLGVFLKMDRKTERFIGNDKANQLLARDYRRPYVVPEKV
ncbi:MAG: Gfo/Idh/MocA family oxidoreductase [Verrucomicrobia subdivision 3 bacterium]|nr:Gfo/Idh/MocA family oxidoreductase [Limisphaerales bacterium]